MNKKIIWVLAGLLISGLIGYVIYARQMKIEQVTLRSPDNSALKARVTLQLNRASPVYIRYWKKGSDTLYRTPTHAASRHHSLDLMLLEPGTEYQYQIVLDRLLAGRSEV